MRPITVRRGFDHDPCPGSTAEYGGEAFGLRPDPTLDQLAPLGQETDLAFPLVDV